jgi:flagellin-like hook-associated protein FlgL
MHVPPSPGSDADARPQAVGSEPVTRLPQFVGQRIETVKETARLAGWAVRTEFVEPTLDDQPEGLVVGQQPHAGGAMTIGAVLAVEVVRRKPWGERYGRAAAVALAVVFAALAVVFALLWNNSGGGSDDELEALRAENAALEAQVAAAAGEDGELVETLQAQVTDLTQKLAAAEALAAKQQADLTKAQTDLATVTKERDAALKEAAELRAQLGGIQQSVTAMPNYVGQQQVAVEDFAKSKKYELVVEKVTTSASPAAPGTVLAQLPKAGIPLVEGSTIWIRVYSTS